MAGPIPTRRIPQLTDYGVPLGGTELLEIWVVNTSRRITARDFCLPAVDPIVMSVDMSSTHPASRYLASANGTVAITDNGPGQTLDLSVAANLINASFVTVTDEDVLFPASRQIVQGLGIQITDNGPGNTLEIAMLGTGALPANPTALVGLTTVNGVANTWMRSDAAPALDQSIAPTWTGNHNFTGNQNLVSNLLPQWIFVETDAAADNRAWPIRISGEQFTIGALNDLGSVYTPWVAVDRTTTTIDTINLLSTNLLWNGAPIAGGVTGLANPTASVGLAVVNGVAVTAMRSDAAPPLDQAIAPTWTGIHTHAAATRGNRVAHTTGANQALDLATANCFYETLGANTAFTFTNPPAAGREMTFTIYLQQDGVGTRVPTWPASVHWSDGITPVLTTTINRLDAVTLTTVDGGVTYYGGQVLANMVP